MQLSTVAASPKNTWLNYYAKFLNIYVTIHYILYVFSKLFPWSRFLYDPVLILIANLFWVYKYTCQCFRTFLRIRPCWKLIEFRCFSNVSAKLFMILNPLKCTDCFFIILNDSWMKGWSYWQRIQGLGLMFGNILNTHQMQPSDSAHIEQFHTWLITFVGNGKLTKYIKPIPLPCRANCL